MRLRVIVTDYDGTINSAITISPTNVRRLESRHNRNGLAGNFAASLSEAIERRYKSSHAN